MVLASNDTAQRRRPLHCANKDLLSNLARPVPYGRGGRQRHRRCYLHFANQMKGRRNCEGMLFRLAIYSVAGGWSKRLGE